MSPVIKKLLLAIAVLAIIGAIIVYKMWTKPHKDVEASKAINVNATALVEAYEKDEAGANTLYLDKVLQVTGVVESVKTNQDGGAVITLKGSTMGVVQGTIEKAGGALPQAGSSITIKGICTGYLTDVILVRCVVEN